MNTVSLLSFLFAIYLIGAVQSQNDTESSAVVKRTEVRDENGQYILSYITREGTIFNEQGKLKKLANDDGEVLIKEGSYQYKSPEGEAISLKYVADEDGFRPEGSHLPVPVQPVQPVFTEN